MTRAKLLGVIGILGGAVSFAACGGNDDAAGPSQDEPVIHVTLADSGTDTGVAPESFSLTVAKMGNGTGSVSSAPAGIACGADCSESYAAGTSITLTATPDAGMSFAGWAGGGCFGTSTCVVILGADTTVRAAFAQENALVVTKAGSGEGTITSNAGAGIDCGATCANLYPSGAVVTLTATPIGDAVFTGWSGTCVGTGACTVTMNESTSVTANFIGRFDLTVENVGTGASNGTVTSAPTGVACGATCSLRVWAGTPVTLTAAATGGATFAGWLGAGCGGIGTCDVTVGAATTVKALFTTTTVTFAANGSGATGTPQTWSVPAGVTYARIRAEGAHGCVGDHGDPAGARLIGTFAVTPLQGIDVRVGQRPSGLGGGGGTFVAQGSSLLIAAGAGGCASVGSSIAQVELEGRIVTSGGTAGATARSDNGAGGASSSGSNSGAGGGWSTDGAGVGKGLAYKNGGMGGSGVDDNFGGYGGGGAGTGPWGQGAGGGYSGGSCGDTFDGSTGTWVGCGGGGSLNNGLDPANTSGAVAGDGQVVILY